MGVGPLGGPGAEPHPSRTLENFRNFLKNCLWKLLKKHYFSIFFKKVNKPCVNFSRVWTKNAYFLEILRKFPKDFVRKLRKINYFSLFFKKLKNKCFHFSPFGQKTQIVGKFWENFEKFDIHSIGKIEFLTIFGKVVAKNRAFGNNIIFLQQFFPFRGGGRIFPLFPLDTPLVYLSTKSILVYYLSVWRSLSLTFIYII